jgi:hypothetical protein
MARQTFTGGDIVGAPPASHTPVANTVTRTNLWVPALWTPIPALDMQPGKLYELLCGGVYSTTATPTIIVNPTLGTSATPSSNAALGASRTTALPSSVTAASWFGRFVLAVRALGIAAAGATVTGNGQMSFQGAAAGLDVDLGIGGTVLATADHTINQGLLLDVTWGAASASNTIAAQWTSLRSLN